MPCGPPARRKVNLIDAHRLFLPELPAATRYHVPGPARGSPQRRGFAGDRDRPERPQLSG
jgi:hypothetical protein